jgi:hypothetical protein
MCEGAAAAAAALRVRALCVRAPPHHATLPSSVFILNAQRRSPLLRMI